jgi:hypothetical protein
MQLLTRRLVATFSLTLILGTLFAQFASPLALAAELEAGAPAKNAATTKTIDPEAPASSIDTPEEVIGILQSITNWMFTIFLTVAAAMIIYAAFIYLTSGGGEGVEKAHSMILYAAIAIVVATLSRSLVLLVKNFVK